MINEKNPYYKFLSVEDKEHILVVNHIKKFYPNAICFHVPNEGKKSSFERYKHSLMGALKGVPDFIFLEPKREKKKDGAGVDYYDVKYYGLAIELKAPEHIRIVQKGKDAGKSVKAKGTVSQEQKQLINKLSTKKYRAVVCFGASQAIQEIDNYFK